MEIQNKQNKAMDGSDVQNKADIPTNVIAVSQLINQYFFPGGGIWKPMNVKAPNIEQAEEIHRATRQPVIPAEEVHNDTEQPAAPAETEGKVEDSETKE